MAIDDVEMQKPLDEENEQGVGLFEDNPVVARAEAEEHITVPHECRCKDCVQAFWYRQGDGDRLQCCCGVTASKTFWSSYNAQYGSSPDKWVTCCEGHEDLIKPRIEKQLASRGQSDCACLYCGKYAMWFVMGCELQCYCKCLHRLVYDGETRQGYVQDCNGIHPANGSVYSDEGED